MRLIAPHFEAYAGQREEQALLDMALGSEGVEYLPWDALKETTFPETDGIFWQGISSYHHRLEVFETLLEQAENQNAISINPVSLLRWNLQKTYLRELKTKGIPILPTLWMEEFSRQKIQALQQPDVIVKPVISAGAHLTYRLQEGNDATWNEAQKSYAEKPGTPIMVQPFAPEILERGELSFLFFGGEFSHLVCKTPQTGDYRIQHVHGGSYHREEPAPELLKQARKVLAALPEKPVYARIDGIEREGKLLLMEVELIEPYFYLDAAPEKAELFARTIRKRLETSQPSAAA